MPAAFFTMLICPVAGLIDAFFTSNAIRHHLAVWLIGLLSCVLGLILVCILFLTSILAIAQS